MEKETNTVKTWTSKRKWTVTLLVGAYCFLAPFTSTIFAPSLASVMAGTNETNPEKGALHIAIFLIAFAVAPIFLAPLSEIYGRTIVLRTGNVVFAVFCVGGGFCQTVRCPLKKIFELCLSFVDSSAWRLQILCRRRRFFVASHYGRCSVRRMGPGRKRSCIWSVGDCHVSTINNENRDGILMFKVSWDRSLVPSAVAGCPNVPRGDGPAGFR